MVTLFVIVCLKVMLQPFERVKLNPVKKRVAPPETVDAEMLVRLAHSAADRYVKLQLLAGQSLKEVSLEETSTS